MAAPDTNPVVNRTEEVPVIEPPKSRHERFRVLISRRRSKRWRLWLIIGALAIVLVGGLFLWRYFGSYESTDDAQVDVHLNPVSSRISGYVIKVNVGDNQWVGKGTVLAEIDPRDYQVAVDKARADLANAEATARSLNIVVPVTSVNTSSQLSSTASDVENAQAGINAAEKELAATHAQVEEAEANDVKTQDDLKRYKLLVDKREISAQIYDQSLAAARAGTATVAAARANEEAARQAVQQARSKLSQAEANHRYAQTGPQQVASSRARALSAVADVKQKRANLEQAELNLQYTRIVAPISGEVNKTVVVGLNVLPGQQLLTIVPLEDIWITANFKETQLGYMRPGQRVKISVDSNGRTYKGSVDSIGGATGPVFSVLPPENATGNYVKIVQRVPVKIVLDPGENRDHWLRPGMSVEPKVYLR
ncbi:MAG TPA: HlyD family secretion protein [Candidatus Angelobacter sp.]|nr:HlyD family secretion protein [Candidatus Angelobacter sp.]